MDFFSGALQGVAVPEPIADPGREESETDCPGTGRRTGDAVVEGAEDETAGVNIVGEDWPSFRLEEALFFCSGGSVIVIDAVVEGEVKAWESEWWRLKEFPAQNWGNLQSWY